MKKIAVILILLTLILSVFSSCASKVVNPDQSEPSGNIDGKSTRLTKYGYTIKVAGIPDSGVKFSNFSGIEYEDEDWDSFKDPKAKESVSLSVNGLNLTGTYLRSRMKDYIQCDEYRTQDWGHFVIDKNGNLLSYYSGRTKYESNNKLTQSECEKIATDFLLGVADINIDDYEIVTKYEEDRSDVPEYYIEFIKYVDGMESSDQALIIVSETGHLCSYSSSMLGRIPKDAKHNFNMEKVNLLVTERRDTLLADAVQVYDKVEYGEFKYTLKMDKNGKYFLDCRAPANCILELQDGYQEIRGADIWFVIE